MGLFLFEAAMPIESATYLSQLDAANPTSADPKSEGDNHLRMVKAALKATFPSFGASALNATQAQIDGVVSSISVQAGTTAGLITLSSSGAFVGGRLTLTSSNTTTTNPSSTTSNVIAFRNKTPGTTAVPIAGGIMLDAYRDIHDPAYAAGIWFERDSVSGGLSSSGSVVIGTTDAPESTVLPTKRIRISPSGRVYLNSTNDSYGSESTLQVTAQGIGASQGCIHAVLPNGGTAAAVTTQSVSAAGTSWYHLVGQSGNGSGVTVNNVFIYGNGNIQNTNNSYGAISDVHLKRDIVDATPKLDSLKRVRVVNYVLKDDPAQTKQLGVISQELMEIFPSMVEEVIPPEIAGVQQSPTLTVKYSVFVPILIKAMQELAAQVAALEAKSA